MGIWQICKDIVLVEEREVDEEKLVEQIQCPHDLGGCGRFIDRRSGTQIYIDLRTGKRLRKPAQIMHSIAFGVFVAVIVVGTLAWRVFPLLINDRNIFSTLGIFLVLGFMLWLLVTGLSLLEREKVQSKADRIEIYHCPNPACGLRSKFRNGKPVTPK